MSDQNGTTGGAVRARIPQAQAMPGVAVAQGVMPNQPRPILNLSNDVPKGVCRFYWAGGCRFGDSCWLIHPGDRPSNLQVPQQAQQQQQQQPQQPPPQPVQQPRGVLAASPVGGGLMMMPSNMYYPGGTAMAPPMPMVAQQARPSRPRRRNNGPMVDRSEIQCWYYPGSCRYGDSCKFKHAGNPGQGQQGQFRPQAPTAAGTGPGASAVPGSPVVNPAVASTMGGATSEMNSASRPAPAVSQGVANGQGEQQPDQSNGNGAPVSNGVPAAADAAAAGADNASPSTMSQNGAVPATAGNGDQAQSSPNESG